MHDDNEVFYIGVESVFPVQRDIDFWTMTMILTAGKYLRWWQQTDDDGDDDSPFDLWSASLSERFADTWQILLHTVMMTMMIFKITKKDMLMNDYYKQHNDTN